jgi:hypothetical protein
MYNAISNGNKFIPLGNFALIYETHSPYPNTISVHQNLKYSHGNKISISKKPL